MNLKLSLRNNLIYCAIFALMAGIVFPGLFKGTETALYDLHMSSSGHLANEDIVLVSIDDRTLEKIDGEPSRDIIARALELVIESNPKTITFTQPMPKLESDMGERYLQSMQTQLLELKQRLKLSESASERASLDALIAELESALSALQTDERLAEVIQTHPRLVLPLVLNRSVTEDNTIDNEHALSALQANTKLVSELPDTTAYFKLSPPNPILTEATRYFGIRNNTLDDDNIIRHERFIWGHSQKLFPSLALTTVLLAVSDQENTQNNAFSLATPNIDSFQFKSLSSELPSNAFLNTRFYSGTLQDNFSLYSLYDVFAESVPSQVFADKIVLFGTSGLSNSSKNTYANGEQMTGLEATAHTVSSFLNEDWIKRNNTQRFIEFILYVLILAYLILLAPRISTLTAWVATIVVSLFLILLEFGALEQSYWFKLFTPAMFLITGQIVHDFLHMRSHEQRSLKAKKEQDLNNYQLGLALQKQGSLDTALEKFLACTPATNLLSPLYNLGLEYERKRQYSKASAVYTYMQDIDAGYLDIQARKEQMNSSTQAISTQQILGATGPGTNLVLSGANIESPQLGRYIIERELGRGAMSVVYLGKDPSLERTVAIKVQQFTGDDIDNVNKMRSRFMSEARTAGKLNHPDIITIYDVGEESDLAYIAMEYLHGEPLDMYVNDIRLSDTKILNLAIRVAGALGYAHQHKVIHRDIKPSNIIYDDREDKIHITDFGIAHIQDAGLTQTGTVVGTPSYMSPEQITGRSVSPRSDLFSFGVTLYQLLTGRLPFQADTLASLLYKITSESPVPIEAIRPDLPAEISMIIDRLLKKDPGDRYKDAEELAKDLEDCKNTLKNSV